MTRHALAVAAALLVALGVWLLAGIDFTPSAEVIYQPGVIIPGTPAPTPTEGIYSHAV